MNQPRVKAPLRKEAKDVQSSEEVYDMGSGSCLHRVDA
jgi:hypothetical protein